MEQIDFYVATGEPIANYAETSDADVEKAVVTVKKALVVAIGQKWIQKNASICKRRRKPLSAYRRVRPP